VEFLDSGGNWVPLAPATPAFDGTDATGASAWSNKYYLNDYVQALDPLTPLAGTVGHLRVAFRSNNNSVSSGVCVEELTIDSEDDDSDGEGLAGVVDEW